MDEIPGKQWGEEAPPKMDESWWAALMEEEEKHTASGQERRSHEPERHAAVVGSPEDWEWARKLYEDDDTVDLLVIGYNRGGVLVEARSLRGFVPISHLLGFESPGSEEVQAKHLARYVNQRLCLKVIELDPDRGRLVLSQRAGLAEPGKRVELLENLHSGDRVSGSVTNITRFGVFVDLGGVEGLIHVSELSWGRVRHPADVVRCGEKLEVQVISVDRDHDRVALSLKELLPDPWEHVNERFEIGQIVEGHVTNVVKFGAFVGLDEGLEGLIHVSEMGDGTYLHPRSILDEGENVHVRIIHIDQDNRRLGLSLKHLDQPVPDGSEDAFSSETADSIQPI
jgi:small subunit ribosomal protein S1